MWPLGSVNARDDSLQRDFFALIAKSCMWYEKHHIGASAVDANKSISLSSTQLNAIGY